MPSGRGAGCVTCGSHLGPPVITLMAAEWLTAQVSLPTGQRDPLPAASGTRGGRNEWEAQTLWTRARSRPSGALPRLFPAQAPVLRPRLQGSRAGVSWVSQGPQQKGGRRCAGTQSKIHSDRRPGLQVSQGTKEAAGAAGGQARPAPSGTRFLCEPQGGAVTKGSGRGDQWNPRGYI